MKVMLVNPPRFEGMPVIREERCEIVERYSVLEPYSLLQIAAILRKDGHQVSLMDLNGFDLGYDELMTNVESSRPDAVVFRFTPTTFDHDIKTAVVAKAAHEGMKTIGLCWTLRTRAEEVLREAPDLDIYATREYEVSVKGIVDALSKGEDLRSVGGAAFRTDKGVTINPGPEPLDDLSSLPLPAFDLLPSLDPYFVTAPAGKPYTIMYTSKGCPFGCSFCTVAGTKWKPRTAESVMEELRMLKRDYHIRTVSFFDETFTLDRKRVEAITDSMISEDLDIRWYCNTRAHLVDREMLKRMYRAGCRGISYGVESGSQKILDTADKRIKVEQARDAILWAKNEGIKVFASFIIGLPGEDWSTVRETIRFVGDTLPTSAEFNVAVPYPGTELYDRVVGKDQQLDFRSLYQHAAVVGTKSLSPSDLDEARRMAYRSLYFNPRWWMSNVKHVLRHPEDMNLAAIYAGKVLSNYFVHRMEHAH
ncbi:MAG: radical SAM protein [Methanomassiliicoccales archaeon]|nr:radical SAM protein [Methanomassiliicoccales archaeon]